MFYKQNPTIGPKPGFINPGICSENSKARKKTNTGRKRQNRRGVATWLLDVMRMRIYVSTPPVQVPLVAARPCVAPGQ